MNIIQAALAQEAIAFQNGSFKAAMIELFEEARKCDEATLRDPSSDIIRDIQSCIKSYTNLSVTLIVGDEDLGAYPIDINVNHALIPMTMRKMFNSADGMKLIKEAEGGILRGGVNLRTGKVSGAFAEINNEITISVDEVKTSFLTVPLVVGGIMHEIGHLFIWFELLSRSITTNQVLAGVSRALDKSVGADQREVILIAAKDALHLNFDVKDLAKSTDKMVIETVLVAETVKRTVSELGSDIYDMNSFEMLADQYAARQGCGVEVVELMDRYLRAGKDRAYSNSTLFFAGECGKLIWNVATIGALGVIGSTLGGVGGMVTLASLRGLQIWTTSLFTEETVPSEMYDRTAIRYQRIRNALVEGIKNRKLPKHRIAALKADIESIDNLMKAVHDNQTFAKTIATFIFRNKRIAQKKETLQRQLEDLVANRLFVSAATAKLLN